MSEMDTILPRKKRPSEIAIEHLIEVLRQEADKKDSIKLIGQQWDRYSKATITPDEIRLLEK